MTTVACWLNRESTENLWVVSDSLISAPEDKNCFTPLTNNGVKIFKLPIVCRSVSRDGMFDNKYFDASIGFAYAGSTLIGQNTANILSFILSNLAARSHDRFPSLKEIAETANKIMQSMGEDIKSSWEAAILGYCPKDQKLEVFHLQKKIME